MKKQKVISLLLAAALMVPMCIPVVGAAEAEKVLDQTTSSTDIVIGSTVNLPTIKVTIGATTDIVANPYKMSYKPDGSSIDDDPIVSTATTIESTSTIDVDVTAKPSLTTSSDDLVVLTSSIKDRTQKSIFLQFNMDTITTVVTTDLETTASNYDGVSGQHAPIKKENDAPLNQAKITLAAIDTTNTESWGAFRITGDCSGTGWTNDDAVTVKITFDIAPVVPTT